MSVRSSALYRPRQRTAIYQVIPTIMYQVRGVKNIYSTPRYPQSNNQDEVTNKKLLSYLKKRLISTKGKWVDELPIALWAYGTTPRQPTGETSYALAFGAEALIPIESRLDILRTRDTTELSQALDELEESRYRTAVRMAEYHRQASRQRDKMIKPRAFKKGDHVL